VKRKRRTPGIKRMADAPAYAQIVRRQGNHLKLAHRSICLVSVAAFLVCGCESMKIHRQTSLAEHLRLAPDIPAPLRVGHTSSVRLSLTNISDDPVRGCLAGLPLDAGLPPEIAGPQQGCRLAPHPFLPLSPQKFGAIISTDGSFSRILHPDCAVRFELSPAESHTWTLALAVPANYSVTEVSLRCTVEVTSGKGCSPTYGCYTAQVRSPDTVYYLPERPDRL